MDKIQEYLEGEVKDGRMSGPFSQTEVESILRGPFFSSPLLVAVQPQAPGVPDKIRICRHLSKDARSVPSVNSHVEKDSFPTRFDTASRVADIVRVFLFLFQFYSTILYSNSSIRTIHPFHSHYTAILFLFIAIPILLICLYFLFINPLAPFCSSYSHYFNPLSLLAYSSISYMHFFRSQWHRLVRRLAVLILRNSTALALSFPIINHGWLCRVIQANFGLNIAILLVWEVQAATPVWLAMLLSTFG